MSLCVCVCERGGWGDRQKDRRMDRKTEVGIGGMCVMVCERQQMYTL